MTATAHATIDGTAASSGRLSSVASGVLEFVWPMYLTLVFTLGAWVLVPTLLFGWQPVTIISGSMAPAIQPGHVVVVEPFTGQELAPGTVVTYRDLDLDRLVTHRIAEVDEDGTITTRGDANAVDDAAPLTTDRIVGVGRLVVPAAGLPALWAHQGRTDLLAVVVVLTVLATVAAAGAASDGVRRVRRQLSLRRGTGRRSRVRTIALGAAVVASIGFVGATAVSRAAFVGAQDNPSNSFQAGTVAAPTGLTATCDPVDLLSSTRTVRVKWNGVSGATYRLERQTSLLGSWTVLTTGTATSYTDTVPNLVLSTTTYRVRAVSGTWESAAPTYSLICV